MMPFLSVADWHDLLRMHAWKNKNKNILRQQNKTKQNKKQQKRGGTQTTVQTSIRM